MTKAPDARNETTDGMSEDRLRDFERFIAQHHDFEAHSVAELVVEIRRLQSVCRERDQPADDSPLESAHAFAPGDPAIWGPKCRLCGMLPTAARHRGVPHRWIQGSPYEACAVCGTDPRNSIHRDLKPANIHINHYDPSLSPEALARLDELVIGAVKSRPPATRPEFDPASVVRAEDGSLVAPMPPRVDADARAQTLEDESRAARNALASALDLIDGEHSSSLVNCATRAAELLAALVDLRRHVRRCPLGWHDGRLITNRSTDDADVIVWLQELERLLALEDVSPVLPRTDRERRPPTADPFGEY